jgi:Protein of unknown function (DUF3300)
MNTRIIAATLVLLTACSTSRNQDSAKPQSLKQMGSVEQLLAPVALYPDPLIAQILISAQDPPKVTELDKWLKANQKLKGSQLQDAALKAGFDPSFVALTLFPTVVARMADQISWTTLVGQAFTADRSAVFDAIQRLRKQAQNVGTLKTTEQQAVSTKTTSSGNDVIVIEPANPQVVYVPQYNPEVVYTQPPQTTTVVVQEDDNTDEVIAAGLIAFTAGIAVGATMNNPYYYGPYGWHGGAYMYNEAWDDYYDHREDARDDWMDHREDVMENRGDLARDRQEQVTERRQTSQEQRTERQQNRVENRPEGTQQRAAAPRNQNAATQRTQSSAAATGAATQGQRVDRQGSAEARGYGERTGGQGVQRTSSDAFSGYSSGASQRSSSDRGHRSVSSSRGSGGGNRRR